MNVSSRWSVQKPMTRSTLALLYQERSNSTISPAVGKCWMYRWKYHWPCSRSDGLLSATVRADLGSRCSVKRLMVPPLPAASRPSKTTTFLSPWSWPQYWNFSSSTCSRYFSSSYSSRDIRSSYG